MITRSVLHSEIDTEYSSSYIAYGYYTQHGFILLLSSLGLKYSQAKKLLPKFVNIVEVNAPDVITRTHLSQEMKNTILKRIMERCRVYKKEEI